MRKFFVPPTLVCVLALAASCSTIVNMERTYPPEALLPADSNRFLFVNFYDYQVPDFIRDSHEEGYAAAVKGFAMGLSSTIQTDPRALFMIGDSLRKGFTVISMQYPEFSDTVRALCSRYGANLLVALD